MRYNRGHQWERMAYNFKALEKNQEYIESEGEFD